VTVRFRTTTLIVVALCALVVAGGALAGAATSTKVIAFTGKYAGTAVTKVTDDVADISATGSGSGTLIGAGKITGKGSGDTSQQPCVPFGGSGTLSGGGGTIAFRVLAAARGCGDEAGQVFSVVGKASVLRATGKLARAKGTLKFTGIYDRGAGTFSVKFSGSLTR